MKGTRVWAGLRSAGEAVSGVIGDGLTPTRQANRHRDADLEQGWTQLFREGVDTADQSMASNASDRIKEIRGSRADEDTPIERRVAPYVAAVVVALVVVWSPAQAWIAWSGDHPVLASLVALLGVVGVVFAWLFLRGLKVRRIAAVEAAAPPPAEGSEAARIHRQVQLLSAQAALHEAEAKAIQARAVSETRRELTAGTDTTNDVEARIMRAMNAALPGSVFERALENGESLRPEYKVGDNGSLSIRFPLPLDTNAGKFNVRQFAASMRTEPNRIQMLPSPHDGEVSLRVLRDDPSQIAPEPFALLGRAADLSEGIPLGSSALGELYRLSLANQHLLIVGSTGSGKTSLMRLFLAAVLSDPRTRIFLVNHKPDGDLFAPGYIEAEAGDDAQEAIAVLRRIKAIMQERYEWKSETHGDPVKEFGHVVLFADEFQNTRLDPEEDELFRDVLNRGRSAGVRIVGATVEATKDSVSTSVIGQFGARVGMEHPELWTEQRLFKSSTGMLERLNAGEIFIRTRDQKEPVYVKTPEVTIEDFQEHLAAAAGWRSPVVPALPQEAYVDIVAECLAVIGSANGAHRGPLLEGLRAAGLDLTEDDLVAELGERDVSLVQVKIDGSNRLGVRRSDLEAAL